jgi:hypothetical protein
VLESYNPKPFTLIHRDRYRGLTMMHDDEHSYAQGRRPKLEAALHRRKAQPAAHASCMAFNAASHAAEACCQTLIRLPGQRHQEIAIPEYGGLRLPRGWLHGAAKRCRTTCRRQVELGSAHLTDRKRRCGRRGRWRRPSGRGSGAGPKRTSRSRCCTAAAPSGLACLHAAAAHTCASKFM